jgi:hypothetical protein
MRSPRRRALRRSVPAARGTAALAVALACFAPARHAEAAAPRYAFAVIGSTLQDVADEAPTRRLIEAIGRENPSFVVYDGNIKGASEACRDAL